MLLKKYFQIYILVLVTLMISCSAKQTLDTDALDFDITTPKILNGDSRIEQYLAYLNHKNVAIVANHTSVVDGVLLSDTLKRLGVNVVKVFTPEHGYKGNFDAGAKVENSLDDEIEVISLYGKTKKPTPDNMKGVDVVLYDLQDVGVRFYTYISTMHYVMEACAESGIPFVVLDRPNPNGDYIAGPILELDCKSFVGMHPIPIVYGLTAGELACMINAEGWLKDGIKCDLKVIPVSGYSHSMRLPIEIPPSPNLKSNLAIRLYPSLCLLEGSTVSVGRGTSYPFTIIGVPDSTMGNFAFVPQSIEGAKNPMYKDIKCFGDDLRNESDTLQFTLKYLMKYFNKMKDTFWGNVRMFDLLAGTTNLRKQMNAGISEDSILLTWQKDLQEYDKLRRKYFLYDRDDVVKTEYAPLIWKEKMFSPEVDTILSRMTIEEQIAQLIWITLNNNDSQQEVDKVLKTIEKYKPGGILILHSTPHQTLKFVREANNNSITPILFAADAENGLAMKYDNVIKFPKNISLGAIADTSLIEELGEAIAIQLKSCGLNVNFAPVVDVNTNSKNPIIGNRSFGENPKRVAICANAYIKGLQKNGIISVVKHFPGHGDTSQDSHKTLPIIYADSLRLDSIELYPFRKTIENGIMGVMSAHILVPSIDASNKTASLSPIFLRTILRQQLGFEGLIVTDAINMAGMQISANGENAESAALIAGNDVAEFSTDIKTAIQSVKLKLSNGELDSLDFQNSVRRILAAKKWAYSQAFDYHGYPEIVVNNIYMECLLDRLYSASITVLKDNDLGRSRISKIQYFGDWEHLSIENKDNLNNKTELLLVDDRNINGYNLYVDKCKKSEKNKYIVAYAGNPYKISQLHLDNVASFILVYENNKNAKRALQNFMLYGGTASGIFPITVDTYSEGLGKYIERKFNMMNN